jgi:hypothetical protein
MKTTVYTIKNNGASYQTNDTEEAKSLIEQDATVKAHYTEVVKQTPEDKGTLIMSQTPEWVEDVDARVMADKNSWVDAQEHR